MDAKPVRRYRKPAYPTRLEVLADADLLLRHVPGGWRKSAVTMAALTACLGTSSCVHERGDKAGTLAKPAVVAPIFKHGDGRGAIGCVAVTPPAFLSEEEALVIIREELAKVGMTAMERDVLLPGVVLGQVFVDLKGTFGELPKEMNTVVTPEMRKRGYEGIEVPKTRKTLKVDVVYKESRVAVEYLSGDDYAPLGGLQWPGTAREYDFIELARRIAKTVRKEGKGVRLGVFYDPMTGIGRPISWNDDEDEYAHLPDLTEEQARNVSREKLRLQVKDFVDWLKGQGVI